MKKEISVHQLKGKSISNELLSTQKELQQTKPNFEEFNTKLRTTMSTTKKELIRKDKESRQEALGLQTRIAELEKEVKAAREDATREEDQRRGIEEDRNKDISEKSRQIVAPQNEIRVLKTEIQWLQRQNTVFEDILASQNMASQTRAQEV